jgi:hypothetical protein
MPAPERALRKGEMHSRHGLGVARRLLRLATRATAALVSAGALGLLETATASAVTDAGAVEVVTPGNLSPLNGGGSATPFTLRLPGGAACPGDTAHKGYLVFSYTIPAAVKPDHIFFPGGSPKVGVDLIDTAGVPFVTEATGVNTGVVLQPPVFVWSRYDHHPEALPPGTYNVGLACALLDRPVTYWNTQITFVASSTDPGGFTWRVANPVRIASRGSSVPMVAVVAGGLVLAAGVALAVRHRRRSPAPTEALP